MSDRMQNLYEGVSLLVKLANKGPILRLGDGTELEGDAAADYLDERRARLSDDLDQFDRELESRRPKRTIGWHALTAGSGGLLGGILGNAVTYAASPKVRAVGTAAGVLGGSALGLGAAERDLSNRQKDYDTRAEVLRQVVHGGYQPNLANLDSLAKHFRAQGASAPQEKTSGLRDAVTRGVKRYGELMRGTKRESLRAEYDAAEAALRAMGPEPQRHHVREVLGRRPRDLREAETVYRQMVRDNAAKSRKAVDRVNSAADAWRAEDDAVRKARGRTLLAAVGVPTAGLAGVGALSSLSKGKGADQGEEKTSGLRDAVTRGTKRYVELLRGGDSDHLRHSLEWKE